MIRPLPAAVTGKNGTAAKGYMTFSTEYYSGTVYFLSEYYNGKVIFLHFSRKKSCFSVKKHYIPITNHREVSAY